jgi:hypothetical protein
MLLRVPQGTLLNRIYHRGCTVFAARRAPVVVVMVVGQDKFNRKLRKERLPMRVNCTHW